MPQNPKLFVHGTMVEICFRTEDGLPLVCAKFMQAIVTSYLARAQTKYPVTICHFVVMGNHLHLTLVIDQPQNIPCFIDYFKRESAHAINRLLGRKKRTVWSDGYDSPIILDAAKAIERICYIYTNPQKANLVDKIEEYPNLNSWSAFLDGGETIETKRIPRTAIFRLPLAKMSFEAEEQLAHLLLSKGKEECVLEITPYAWLKCFPETKNADTKEVRKLIINEVRRLEEELRSTRTRPVVGDHALRLQRMDKQYTTEKFGIRMICLASLPVTRKAFIKWFRSCCKEVNSRIHKYPGGMFAPGGFLFTNVVPYFVPIVCEAGAA